MPNLTPEAWAQIRADYEHTERPIEDICAAHGISSGTLRDRVRRWDWTRRRQRIPHEGPPPPPVLPAAPRPAAACPATRLAATLDADRTIENNAPTFGAAPHVASPEVAPVDVSPARIAQRLQGAVARVLPAIETTLSRIADGPTQPRELENAARALGALTRTLRELNALLAQHAVKETEYENIDHFRAELARKIEALIDERPKHETDGDGATGDGEIEPSPS